MTAARAAQDGGVIAKMDRARLALREAKTIQDTKQIVDVARAAEVYARQQKLGDEAIGYAHAIKIEALRRLGEMLRESPKRGPEHSRGGGSKGSKRVPLPAAPPTLADLGIDRKVSAVAQKLADLPDEQFEDVRQGATTIAKAIREVEHARRPKVALPTAGKYRVIYADPPWSYGNSGLQQYGHASFHYPAMSIRELCELRVADLAEPNAVLFLWVTSPLLAESFAVIRAWGFEYKTSFVWDKVKHNFGHYNSVRHEFLLVCTRGSCTPTVPKLFDSVQTIERSPEHSEKPKQFRKIIDELYPLGNRIELFARAEAEGWDRHSNEI